MAERALEHLASVETVNDLLSSQYRGPALIDVNGRVMDHPTLRGAIDELATKLRGLGLGPGDRIAIVLPNGPEMVLALLAAMAVGCAAPLNPKYREHEFRFYLEDLNAAALLVMKDSASDARAAIPEHTIVVDVSSDGANVEFVTAAGAAKAPTTSRPGPDDQALVLHTSGTTSRPKIVPLRQRNLASSARNIARALELTQHDRALAVMPLFHIHGIMASMLAPLSAGGAVIATTGFDAFKFHRWVAELQPTYYTAVPTMHQMVLARAGQPTKTSLRFVRSSSAAMPTSVLDGLQTLFDVPVIEAYGMTEASHQMTCNPLPPRSIKPGSVGVPTGIEVTILDAAGHELPCGATGEVAIKGPSVVDGYENNPAANEAAFTNGWFRTGDQGVLDDDGYLFLTGRLKEQINRGGEKISPIEIDDVVLRHPDIAEAVAFAIPHDKLGEDVGLAVVPVTGSELSEAELRAFIAEQVAPFKVPRLILFVDEIPKGATGKVQRIGMADRLGL
jgi:acyl-CoA synthetase (AMP-forming)/AMP-acid ligase II